jgi:hypothetical protein
MTFRPDSPLNRLVLLWPGVPIAACGFGFGVALYQAGQTQNGTFAALAIAMGCGLALSLGLLFHCFFIDWVEVGVSADGISLRPVGMTWINAQPRLLPWSQIEATHEVVTRQGGHLEIASDGRVIRLERALFSQETYLELSRVLAERSGGWDQFDYKGLPAVA